MSNPNKAKGTRHESAIVDFLNGRWQGYGGLKAYRPAQAGFADSGDIHGLSPFVIQAKDWANPLEAIRQGTASAEEQAIRAGEPFGVAVVKRARSKPEDYYAVMRLGRFAQLVEYVRGLNT